MEGISFTEERIIGILKDRRAGACVADPQARCGDASVCKRKAEYGAMDVSEAKGLKLLEDGNARLKRLLPNAMIDNAALQDLLDKKEVGRSRQRPVSRLWWPAT